VVAGDITPELAPISYGADMDDALRSLTEIISRDEDLSARYPARWLAIKLLEQDENLLDEVKGSPLEEEILRVVQRADTRMEKIYGEPPENIISDYRFGFISGVCRQAVQMVVHDRRTVTDKIDKVVTNRALGPVILLGVLYGIYEFVFWASEKPVEWFEAFFGWMGGLAEAALPDGLVKSMLISGVIDGVGGVLGFVPLILFMFFAIAILEDSGYMARMAFILDRAFKFFGLHGSSVLSLIVSGGISGGCAVPGVMAARTLKSSKERLATILVAPLMNCGAKLPVYALLIGAFFTANMGRMMFLLTLVSWSLALLTALVLRKTVLKGPAAPFVMELPPYRLPTMKGLLIHSWERTWMYIRKAGTVILAISVLLWALMTFPRLPAESAAKYEGSEARAAAALKHSVAGRIGTGLEFFTKPLGFDYRTNIALVGGFAAKEVVVATLGTAYSLGDVDPEETKSLSQRLAEEPGFNPLVAFGLMLFVMLYSPCFVTVVVMKKETGGWKWPIFAMVYTTLFAYVVALVVVQGGRLLGLG
jgi:ferrous iron transport protein B